MTALQKLDYSHDGTPLSGQLIDAGFAELTTDMYGSAVTNPEVERRPDGPRARYDPLLDRLSRAATIEFPSASISGPTA